MRAYAAGGLQYAKHCAQVLQLFASKVHKLGASGVAAQFTGALLADRLIML